MNAVLTQCSSSTHNTFLLLLVILFTHGYYFRNPIRSFCNIQVVVRLSVFLDRQLTRHTFAYLCTYMHTIEPSTPLSKLNHTKRYLFFLSITLDLIIHSFSMHPHNFSQCIMYDNSLIS